MNNPNIAEIDLNADNDKSGSVECNDLNINADNDKSGFVKCNDVENSKNEIGKL